MAKKAIIEETQKRFPGIDWEAFKMLCLVAYTGDRPNLWLTERLFSIVMPSVKKFETADMLCISDFGWGQIDGDVEDMIMEQKSKGMRFYGLNIGSKFGQKMLMAEQSMAMTVLDSILVYDGKECRKFVQAQDCPIS